MPSQKVLLTFLLVLVASAIIAADSNGELQVAFIKTEERFKLFCTAVHLRQYVFGDNDDGDLKIGKMWRGFDDSILMGRSPINNALDSADNFEGKYGSGGNSGRSGVNPTLYLMRSDQ